MSAFPIHLHLHGRRCVVVGGGPVARRKAASLCDAGAQVTVVAPEVVTGLRAEAEAGTIVWTPEFYREEHLTGAFLVFAATDRPEVNAAVVRDARARGALAGRADAPDEGDFISPSAVRRGGLTLTVSTGGQSPTLAALLRERLESEFGPEWETLTAVIGALRPHIQRLPTEAQRKEGLRTLLDDPQMRELARRGRRAEAEARARECLSSS